MMLHFEAFDFLSYSVSRVLINDERFFTGEGDAHRRHITRSLVSRLFRDTLLQSEPRPSLRAPPLPRATPLPKSPAPPSEPHPSLSLGWKWATARVTPRYEPAVKPGQPISSRGGSTSDTSGK
ncbi:hypothetical protein EYF80_037293 [Liparis tanakae]|uniref:Uncharacterized protein n=1 Tax=Liparis tanakae TaxID=230148 RepID=A0A4Z2GGD2_9TELE|nr:hypothetical protein EYF80_037293 [Liparis tanakae]